MEIVFYKSKEHKDHYLLYNAANNCNPERMFQKLTSTGDFPNSGYPVIEITEVSYVLKTDLDFGFFDYLAEKAATNHIPNQYDGGAFRAWYEFKTFDPVKWMNEFYFYENSKNNRFENNSNLVKQIVLF